jgi:hypothetical protein
MGDAAPPRIAPGLFAGAVRAVLPKSPCRITRMVEAIRSVCLHVGEVYGISHEDAPAAVT